MSKKEILQYYIDLCQDQGKLLSRSEYRLQNPKFSSGLIEKLWGNWTNFIQDCPKTAIPQRFEKIKKFDKSADKIVIGFVYDGANLNVKALSVLQKYCKYNKAELGLLWGRALRKSEYFTEDAFVLVKDYLATRFEFEKDPTCIAQDFCILPTQKNPLLHTDKISTSYKTLIVGSPKQYLSVLPYKQYTTYRLACSTGTLSNIDYKDTLTGAIDELYDTTGALILDWNKDKARYDVRQLQIINNEIYDYDKIYTEKGVKTNKSISALVMGDLHLPEENKDVMKKTFSMYNELHPEYVMIHDVASWQSISHHEAHRYLDKFNSRNETNMTLETELQVVTKKLKDIATKFPNIEFKIVRSNHDCFVEKWLNEGEFIKDTTNAKLGAQLFIDYTENKSILGKYLEKNMSILPFNSSFNINGYELSEHGDSGISGSRGTPRQFSRGFEKVVIGHTHSPQIFEKTVVVGTSSELILNYNQKGMTCWAHCHAIIHKNGSFQLIFL